MKENFNTNIIGKKNRLEEAVAYLKGSRVVKTQKEIADQLGTYTSNLSKAINGDEKYLTDNFLQRLSDEYGFSINWLLIGEGQMLKDNTAGRDIITGGTNITGEIEGNATINVDNSRGFSKELSDAQEKNLVLMEEKVDYLESKIKKGEVEPKEVVSLESGSPYHNVDFVNGFAGVEEIAHDNPEYYINYPPANHCEFWVNATGESMKGVIDHGDKIALKLVDKEWFPLGEVYAIVTTNGYRMVKKIVKSEDKECYKLVSANTDKEAFPDQDIPKEMIQTLFKVVAAIKLIN